MSSLICTILYSLRQFLAGNLIYLAPVRPLNYPCSLLDVLCSGSGARLALGASVISYLIVYNEASAPSLLVGVVLATVYGAMAGGS